MGVVDPLRAKTAVRPPRLMAVRPGPGEPRRAGAGLAGGERHAGMPVLWYNFDELPHRRGAMTEDGA